MTPETRRALNAINRRFYDATASDFDATRQAAWPGWERVLDAWRASWLAKTGSRRVLDIGCGNGRFARFLAERCGESLSVLGVDACDALLETARVQCAGLAGAAFEHVDFVEREPAHALPRGPFDGIALFGVLHHVPGAAQRQALLAAALDRVAPGGLLAATFWQFGDRARFRDRALPWSRATCVDPDDLEPGDTLLPWASGEGPPRYCHFASPEEIAGLVAALPAHCVDCFDADGKTGDLNRYLLLRPEGA